MTKPMTFRIVHLSDLHLTKRDGDRRTELNVFDPLSGMNDTFRKIVSKRIIKKADFVLVTGDVTDRGDISSWKIFWKAVMDAGLVSKIFVLPGNHDVCCLGARLPLKRKAYRWADIQKAVRGLRIGGQATKFPSVCIPDKRVVVFGLNSNNLGNLNVATNAMGEIDYFQLRSLASKLHKYRDIPVKIIALHHSPNIPGSETARKRGQRSYSKLERIGHQISQDQRRALILLSVAHRVRLLVHGHLHMEEDRRVGGIRIVGSPSTTEPTSKGKSGNKHQLFTYTVQGDGGQVRCDLRTVVV